MRGGTGRPSDDEGFSIIEVMMALALLAMTMAAMGPFFVRSFQFVAQQRADQAAIELANSAIEQVRALKGSSLLSGRAEARSLAQWQTAFQTGPEAIKAYLAVPGLATPATVNKKLTMKLAWDTTTTDAAAGDDAAISTLAQRMTLDNTVYTRSIFVGECNVYMMNLPGYLRASGDCVNPDVVPEPSATDPRILRFFRAVVLVTWTDKNCADNRCSHIASTLVSRASEPTFDFNRPAPVLADQQAVFYVGRPGEYELKVSGGQLPNTWKMGGTSTLPAGLTLNATTGRISGTPQAAGRYEKLWLTVTDDLKRSDSQPVLTIVVLPPPSVTVPTVLKHTVGAAVTQQIVVSGGVAPYLVKVSNLPTGLRTDLGVDGSTTGTITVSGTAGAPGSFTVTVDVTDTEAMTAKATYTHIVFSPVQLVPLQDQTINLGSSVNVTAVAVGGDSAYTYSATGLPLGVTINARSGLLSGKPTVPGGYQPTVTVKDGLGSTFSDTFALTVRTTTALYVTPPGDQTSTVGDKVDLALESNGGLLGLKPTYSATGLPDGLHLNAAQGTVSGKPTTPGTYPVTVTATNALPPQSSVVNFVWTVR